MDVKPLIDKIESKKAVVGVIGLGYVGLPLVIEFCRAGFNVIGFDVDEKKNTALNSGKSYIRHIPADDIARFAGEGRLTATDDFTRIAEADALLIAVPTPLTGQREPDLRFIESTARAIAPHLRSEHLVILESTTYPGTTEEVLGPLLETESGLKRDTDFLLAYSPEREDPGNPTFSTSTIPKVVGGCSPEALDAADALYSQIIDETVRVSSAATAEAVKLTENIFRCVNIALVNELKLIYSKMGVDVWEVIEAAKTKPFGFMPFYPGPGLGGHCIPIDPFYLSWKAREFDCPTRFIELAGEINSSMPAYVIDILTDALNDAARSVRGAKILVLGMAYKKNVEDVRESPSFDLITRLLGKGAEVDYHDPYVAEIPRTREHADLAGRRSVDLTPEMLASYDAVLIATDHDNIDYQSVVDHAPLVVDTRNATARTTGGNAKIYKA